VLLRRRYAPYEVPPCRVCGEELSVGSMGGGQRTKYAHACPDGVSFRDWSEHYRESEWIAPNDPDHAGLALLDFYLATRDTAARSAVDAVETALRAYLPEDTQ
jgi:hypothetical protein